MSGRARRIVLGCCLVGLAIALGPCGLGCKAEYRPPPAAPEESPGVAPDSQYTWALGYWRKAGPHEWTWTPGRWIAPPHDGAVWTEGHYQHTPDGYIWIDGFWR